MTEIELPGLEGTNPLGFFAALGALRAAGHSDIDATLRWTDQPVPTAVITGIGTIDQLVEIIMEDRRHWLDAEALSFNDATDVKLKNGHLAAYLAESWRGGSRSTDLAAALVTERVVDGAGAAKPTDFHFTAGRQQFLLMARQIRDGVEAADIQAALEAPWRYRSALPSLMWDVTDDRLYALAAVNPAGEKKMTEPGAEWLALVGLTCFPVSIGGRRTLTPGCGGTWKSGTFTWPLWSVPIGFAAARSLIGAIGPDTSPDQLRGWGCTALLRSAIRRSDQGGYGTFGPPIVVWQQSRRESAPTDPFAN